MKKHAYLILVHTDFYVLEKSLQLIDDERNDIYIHVDKKVKKFDFDHFKSIVKKSAIFFVPRIKVYWGGVSIVQAEMILFKEAHKREYEYLHLISGIDMPLKSQDEIHDFCDRHRGKEFVNIVKSHNLSYRLKIFFFPQWYFRHGPLLARIWYIMLRTFQRIFKINRLKKNNLQVEMGSQWISVTGDFVKYLLTKEDFIRKHFNHTLCADELFIQTILSNSEFKDSLFLDSDGIAQGVREIDWSRGHPYIYTADDFEMLKNSSNLFARKFSSETNREIIDKIFEYVSAKQQG